MTPPAPDRVVQAVALSYDESDMAEEAAPRVIAAGQGTLAEAIIARALEFDIPVHESRELVAALMHFDLDQRIPQALYVAVAEVLAWAYRIEQGLDPGADRRGEQTRNAGASA